MSGGENIRVWSLGHAPFQDVYYLQKDLARKRHFDEIPDTVLVVEHDPVYTVGREGRLRLKETSFEHLKQKAPVFFIDRGGDITFHGPGQLVIYPIIKLRKDHRDIHRFIRGWENIIIELLKRFGLAGIRRDGFAGVWMSEREKIASLGFGFSRWVSYHGIGLNVYTDVKYFESIDPCGLAGIKMVNLADYQLRHSHSLLLEQCKKCFYDVLKLWFSDRCVYEEKPQSAADPERSVVPEKSSLPRLETIV